MVQMLGWFSAEAGARFLLEALQRVGVLLQIAREKLKRKVASQLAIFGFVHHAHAARAQLFRRIGVVQNALADQGVQCGFLPVFDSSVAGKMASRM